MLDLFTADIIKSFMAFGYAIWKTTRSGKLLVADPSVCTIARTPAGKWKVISVSTGASNATRGWHCTTFVRPPLHIKNPTCSDWPSPTVLSFPHYLRVRDIEENWLRRDTHNSYPSVFTTIQLEHFKHKGSNGDIIGSMPAPSFYRNIDKYGKAAFMAPSIGNKQVGPTESSFQELAKSRHDAIRNLSEKSTLEREAILAGKNNGLAWDSLTDQSKGEKLHEEHIITDGKKPVETKILLSAADARLQYDRTRHAVLFALGVPPQAVGETVNSERTASSAAIYDVAIGLFLRTVEQYRVAVEEVLKEATMLDDGNYVKYSFGISGIQLNRVLPLLKTNQAIDLLSQTYHLPVSYFDKARVAVMQDADSSKAKQTTAVGKGPQKQLETVAATPSQQNLKH
ncbi:MAG: hypothetical protein CL678_11880 [Bdellovibrionaceae bacterium]|nr:hypothetical protein [Pseudobdellovibrionaceae bacterium]